MARHRHAYRVAADRAEAGLHAAYVAVLDDEAFNLAVLDDVDAQRRCRAGVAPGDGVMPGRASAWLVQAAENRKARRLVKTGNVGADARFVMQVGIDAVEAHGIGRASQHLHAMAVMSQHPHAALREPE